MNCGGYLILLVAIVVSFFLVPPLAVILIIALAIWILHDIFERNRNRHSGPTKPGGGGGSWSVGG